MIQHPYITQLLAAERAARLLAEANAARLARLTAPRRTDLPAASIAIRLCRTGDDAALARLAALEARSLPSGSFVVAELDGELVAALPLLGGEALADPFRPTEHILRLLSLRAAQLRALDDRRPSRRLVSRLARSLL